MILLDSDGATMDTDEQDRLFPVTFRIPVAMIALAFLLRTGCTKPPPGGVQRFSKSIEVGILPADDGHLQWKSGYQVVVLAKVKSGDTIAPVFRITRPRFGRDGDVIQEERWEHQRYYVGDGQSFLVFPSDDDITNYDILIRERLPHRMEKGPWRVWSISADAINSGKPVKLPRFSTLVLLSDRDDEAALLAKHAAAREYVQYLTSR